MRIVILGEIGICFKVFFAELTLLVEVSSVLSVKCYATVFTLHIFSLGKISLNVLKRSEVLFEDVLREQVI
jgi:hypothetical protein